MIHQMHELPVLAETGSLLLLPSTATILRIPLLSLIIFYTECLLYSSTLLRSSSHESMIAVDHPITSQNSVRIQEPQFYEFSQVDQPGMSPVNNIFPQKQITR